MAVTTYGALRHYQFITLYRNYLPLMTVWTLVFAMLLVQWVLAIFERPYSDWSPELDEMKVVIAVPVYNEEPATLDRVLYAMAKQTRLPDVVHIVDDGSKVNYRELYEHWRRDPILGSRLLWARQANSGKKTRAGCMFQRPSRRRHLRHGR